MSLVSCFTGFCDFHRGAFKSLVFAIVAVEGFMISILCGVVVVLCIVVSVGVYYETLKSFGQMISAF